MNHKEKLLEIYKLSYSLNDIEDVNNDTKDFIKTIGGKINTQKGVFTVLVTLITHKIIDPTQDVRKHQSSMSGGFSGRSVDFSYITPTLKESDKLEITDLIDELKLEHGCQIIINGLLPTIKYYLRLITSLDEFVTNYNQLIEKDTEIKKIHKEKWNELITRHLT